MKFMLWYVTHPNWLGKDHDSCAGLIEATEDVMRAQHSV